MRGIWLAPAALLLGGCSLPPALQVASLVLDAFSYVASGKSVTDHGISIVARKDCALLRAVKGDEVCHEIAAETVTVENAPGAAGDGPAIAKAGVGPAIADAGEGRAVAKAEEGPTIAEAGEGFILDEAGRGFILDEAEGIAVLARMNPPALAWPKQP